MGAGEGVSHTPGHLWLGIHPQPSEPVYLTTLLFVLPVGCSGRL